MRKLLVLLLFIIISSFVYGGVIIESGKIKGIVIDVETNQPMEYVTVAVYNKKDSTLVTGGISNKTGQFEIPGIIKGLYYVEVNFVGYKKITFNDVKFNSSGQVIDFGKIILLVSINEISGVEVVAYKQRIEYKIDKKVVNVSQDIISAGGTAVDVLQNTPSVDVDIDGNVALRGSSSFTVLIDGRPSVLTGSDALRQIPATAIQNIEIITNPSAKYDPDGSAGIINIIMKQNILSGFNGIVNAMIGSSDKYRTDMTLNYKTKKYNLFFGSDWSDDTSWGKMMSERATILGDTTKYLISDGSRNMSRGGYNIKGGVDFYLSDKTTLTVSSTGGKYNFDVYGDSKLNEYTFPLSQNIYTTNSSLSNRAGNIFSSNLALQHKFDKKGLEKLDILAYFSNRKGNDYEYQNQYLANSNYVSNDTLQQIKTTSGGNSQDYRLKIDYVKPIGNGKIETGFQSNLEREKEDYKFENYDINSNIWINNSLYSSNMNFKNDVYSTYFTYSNQFGKMQYMAGLRGEYTDRYIYNLKSTEPFTLQRFDYFPSVHLSYNLSEFTQLMSSYSKRIKRPDGRDLDPFASYIDQYTIRVGNPNLKPEYTNSYELQLMQRFGQNFVSFDGFYRVTNDLMTRTQELHDGTIWFTTDNINNDYSLGTEVMGNVNMTKWLNLNASGSIYNYKIKGELNGESVDRESTNYSLKGNATFKFGQNTKVQWMSMYRGPSVSSQGEMSSMLFSNLSVKQELLKNKLSATLSVRDIFGTMKMENKTYSSNFSSWTKMTREPRVFQLTLSYSLNNYKMDKNVNEGSGNGSMEIEY